MLVLVVLVGESCTSMVLGAACASACACGLGRRVLHKRDGWSCLWLCLWSGLGSLTQAWCLKLPVLVLVAWVGESYTGREVEIACACACGLGW